MFDISGLNDHNEAIKAAVALTSSAYLSGWRRRRCSVSLGCTIRILPVFCNSSLLLGLMSNKWAVIMVFSLSTTTWQDAASCPRPNHPANALKRYRLQPKESRLQFWQISFHWQSSCVEDPDLCGDACTIVRSPCDKLTCINFCGSPIKPTEPPVISVKSAIVMLIIYWITQDFWICACVPRGLLNLEVGDPNKR